MLMKCLVASLPTGSTGMVDFGIDAAVNFKVVVADAVKVFGVDVFEVAALVLHANLHGRNGALGKFLGILGQALEVVGRGGTGKGDG